MVMRTTDGGRLSADGVAWRVTRGCRRVLNHADGSVIAVYDRHSYDAGKGKAIKRWKKQLRRIIAA